MERTWKTVYEPFKARIVEPLPVVTRAERESALLAAGGELSGVPADKVLIDLSDDAAVAASSAAQAAAMMRGDRGFAALEKAARGLTGMRHVLLVHAGRAAERALFTAACVAGKTILSNSLGATARANAEAAGARAVDLPAPETLDSSFNSPFKGDVDAYALEARIREAGPAGVAMIVMTLAPDSLGGQPSSMGGLRAAREVSRARGIPLFLDASRFAENAWLVKCRERGYARRTAAEIASEAFGVADGCWVGASGGGFLALNDAPLAEACRAELVLSEGAPESGGLSPRELEALAVGLEESLEEGFLSYRARSIELLGEGLRAAGVPIVEPPGGHAILLDARRLLPQAPPEGLPGRLLARELYLTAGVRGVEAGARAAFVRLAIPRLTYTRAHLDLVLEAVCDVASRAASIALSRPDAAEVAA